MWHLEIYRWIHSAERWCFNAKAIASLAVPSKSWSEHGVASLLDWPCSMSWRVWQLHGSWAVGTREKRWPLGAGTMEEQQCTKRVVINFNAAIIEMKSIGQVTNAVSVTSRIPSCFWKEAYLQVCVLCCNGLTADWWMVHLTDFQPKCIIGSGAKVVRNL